MDERGQGGVLVFHGQSLRLFISPAGRDKLGERFGVWPARIVPLDILHMRQRPLAHHAALFVRHLIS